MTDADIDIYLKRFKYEFSVIKEKGFIKYFLIVADILNWCRDNNIMFGPRGSAAGCLVSYLLNIIDIDPIKHDLVFERFLNPGRKSPPDIDTDISDNRRQDVIDRLKTLYGENNVAFVSTFLQMEDRGIVRDVARVFEVPLNEVDKFCKTINDGLEDAIKNPENAEFISKYPQVITHCLKLVGQPKAYGRHAGGIVISNDDLTQGKNCHLVNRNNFVSTNFSKDDVEFCGLIKFDFLGLSTLSIISDCLDRIKENHNKNIDLYKINTDDKIIFKEISKGNTVGDFQISTWVLTSLIKKMGVENINQLSDALALCRPGPFDSGLTDEYIARKNGKEWERLHPVYEDITKDTFGVIAYQEQIIFVLNKIAGFSMTLADEIRKVIGKKRDAKEFEPYRIQFMEGCKKIGYFSEQEASKFWVDLQSHARYSFNRSHSISYAYVSYFTAWLKQYFPTEFFCAALTYGSEGQKHDILKEAQRTGMEIVPPKIGKSDCFKWIAKGGKMYVPFKEVKGIGEASFDSIKAIGKPQGFFNEFNRNAVKGKLKSVLNDIGAFTEDIPESIDKYFDLGIVFNIEKKYPKLVNLVKDYKNYSIDELLTGEIGTRFFVKDFGEMFRLDNFVSCSDCEQRGNCSIPTHPKKGKYNVGIVSESPDWITSDDSPFLRDSTNRLLKKELNKYGFDISDFYQTSILKCKSKQPTKNQAETCFKKFLTVEQKSVNMKIALMFGKSSVLTTTNETSILRANGKTIWNEELGCWCCYCIPPNLVEYKPEDYRKSFREGIKNFAKTLERLGSFS